MFVGCPISWWENKDDLCEFDRSLLSVAEEAVGIGFGSRRSTHCIGMNVYLGRRSSERPRAKPFVHSKQDIHDQDFLHEDWSFPGLFRLRNHLNKSRDQLKAIAQELNPMYTTFTGSEVCSRKFIVTSGLSSKTSGNLKPIGFANFPHEDKQDYICYDATHLLQYQFDEVLDHILD